MYVVHYVAVRIEYLNRVSKEWWVVRIVDKYATILVTDFKCVNHLYFYQTWRVRFLWSFLIHDYHDLPHFNEFQMILHKYEFFFNHLVHNHHFCHTVHESYWIYINFVIKVSEHEDIFNDYIIEDLTFFNRYLIWYKDIFFYFFLWAYNSFEIF